MNSATPGPGPYDDILDLVRPVSHFPKMSAAARAAQFAPFAALGEDALDAPEGQDDAAR